MISDKRIDSKKIVYLSAAGLLGFAALLIMFFSYEGRLIRSEAGRFVYAGICIFIIIYAALPWVIPGTRMKPEQLFLYYFLTAAVFSLIFIPFGFVPDEYNHYLRTLSLSQLRIFEGTALIPDNLRSIYARKGLDAFVGLWSVKALETTEIVSCTTAIFYPPLSFLPQTVGVVLAGSFTDNLYIILITARAFSLGTTAAIIYFSVKAAPFGKYIIILMSLMPLFIQEAASVSAEGLVNAVIIADISFFFFMREEGRKMTSRRIIIMVILIVLTFSVKPLYCFIGFIFSVLDSEKFFSKRSKTAILLPAYITAVALPILYLATTYFYGFEFSNSVGEGAGISAQLSYILTHPLNYLAVLGRTIACNFLIYVKSCFSLLLLSFQISRKAIIVFVACFAGIILADRKEKIGAKAATAISGAVFFSVFIIFLMEYLQWTPVTNDIISGVQGRYFFPLGGPLCLIIPKPGRLSIVKNYSETAGLSPVTLFVTVFAGLSMFELAAASVSLMF
ncbi:MAG: DUF2142 domain-containing protein [Lachnospiraceae bacterium]|jgi:uncharacterized membrane protein